jgi:hypothetical protein
LALLRGQLVLKTAGSDESKTARILTKKNQEKQAIDR